MTSSTNHVLLGQRQRKCVIGERILNQAELSQPHDQIPRVNWYLHVSTACHKQGKLENFFKHSSFDGNRVMSKLVIDSTASPGCKYNKLSGNYVNVEGQLILTYATLFSLLKRTMGQGWHLFHWYISNQITFIGLVCSENYYRRLRIITRIA